MFLLTVDLTIRDTIAVVEARILLWEMHASIVFIAYSFSDIPDLQELILGIRC
jgi:hypothetical protein